jgi:uroporphyrin-III C-methyltransferase / precorrin-2 dehydrogenase / sirohydrochlorin ferrochelatase
MTVVSEPLSDAMPPERMIAGLDVLRRLMRAAADVAARYGRRGRRLSGRAKVGDSGRGHGRVALVGAGPGDPELLTLKAARALQTADVVLYDNLVSEEILALVPPTADRIDVGKKGYGRSCKQGDINVLMVALAAAGRRVVRLKAGDPLMFGRLEEEITTLIAAGIEFSVVPGISAAQGAAAALNIPLTRRRGARRFQAITGHADNGRLPENFDWAGLADPKATTAVYMPKAIIGDLCAELMRRGLDAAHPAAAVFNATRPSELVLAATLATLPHRIGAVACEGPCIILIGASVEGRATARACAEARLSSASGN